MSLENLEQLPELDIFYGTESELKSVKWNLSTAKFWAEKGYQIKLPEGITPDSIYDEEFLAKRIEEELSPSRAKVVETEIRNMWPEIINLLKPIFSETKLKISEKYTLNLTKYGTNGSYHYKNSTIDLNFAKVTLANRWREILIEEITHIATEELILKYQIDQWTKERVVGLICQKADPDFNIGDFPPMDLQTIDETFNQNYPNVEKILEEISKLREKNI